MLYPTVMVLRGKVQRLRSRDLVCTLGSDDSYPGMALYNGQFCTGALQVGLGVGHYFRYGFCSDPDRL